MQRFAKDGVDIYWLEERPGQCRVVPTWMCDATACMGMAELGPPRVAIEALGCLAALLKVTMDGWCSAASSGASPVKEAPDAESSAAKTAMSLDLDPRLPAPPVAVPEEAVQALAELLLAAIGQILQPPGGGDEQQDHR